MDPLIYILLIYWQLDSKSNAPQKDIFNVQKYFLFLICAVRSFLNTQ
jgi:hypothetical protein